MKALKNEVLQELLRCMDSEISIMEQLSDHLSYKMRELMERNLESANSTDRSIEESLLHLQKAETEREKMVQKLAEILGHSGRAKASDLLQYLPAQDRDELMLRIARMLRATSELQILKKGLEEMLKFEIAYSSTMMQLIHGEESPVTYDRTGNDRGVGEVRRSWSG
ncbi:MAG: hypothetical protein PWP37_587 [Thermotogota bacterium]|nr:hypothetical protein [Thermotogota bacterium]MDK2864395.1 hypothetical protein [Thermotogota bacterium]HCZ05916.1 hypothetical protein [Thermotogota bacterium]